MVRTVRFTDFTDLELLEIEFALEGRPDSAECQSAYRKVAVELDGRGYGRPWVHSGTAEALP